MSKCGGVKALLVVLVLLMVLAIPGSAQEQEAGPRALTQEEAEAMINSGGASCSFVANPGFESGPVGWFQTGSQQIWELPEDAWAGDWVMWQCGYDSCTDSNGQPIDLSGYKDPILFYFWKLESQDTGRPYDVFSGYILDEAGGPLYGLYTYSNMTLPKGHWNWESYDLSGLGLDNTKFQLSFTGVTDLSRPSSFYLDDVLICAREMDMIHLPVVLKNVR